MKEHIQRISYILDHHCEGCQEIRGMTNSSATGYCAFSCEYGKELVQISGSKPIKTRKSTKKPLLMSKEEYIEYKKQGKTDLEIRAMYKTNYASLASLKKEWGFPAMKRGENTKDYLEMIMSL